MLLTSANLSKQAWGEATSTAGEVRICSYEIGVLVWPALFGEDTKMVPTFKTDTPTRSELSDGCTLLGARIPYDLPLVSYAREDVPWCATSSYAEPDWLGVVYNIGN
jgi:tyrosyl-DNA phosphodiesterase-1